MILVELYSKDDCHLCDEALAVLQKVQIEFPFTLKLHKLIQGEMNFEEYKEDFPVIHINKRFAFKHRLNEQMLKIRLQQVANERANPTMDDELELGGEG
jgi:ribosome-associated toxin RatA of RatAB toxin-antitoxin module